MALAIKQQWFYWFWPPARIHSELREFADPAVVSHVWHTEEPDYTIPGLAKAFMQNLTWGSPIIVEGTEMTKSHPLTY